MNIHFLPAVNAILNSLSTIFLLLGYRAVKMGRKEKHRNFMITALVVSALFLTSYLIYHAKAGSVPYPHHDWTRILYLVILIPHIVFAALNVPFILAGVLFAFRGKFTAHRKLMKWVLPVWIYVSISGVVVFIVLYILA